MKKFSGFEAKRSGQAREVLPAGGYVAKVMNAEEIKYDWGEVVVISFDIAEGQYKDFFANDYRGQDREDKKWRGTYRLNVPKDDGSEKDGWTKKTFGNAVWALEDSNPGYKFDWEIAPFKGKTVGVLFRNKEWEYNGQTGWTTECCALTTVSDIRDNKFKMPKDKPLANKFAASAWDNVQSGDNSDLPF